MATCEKKRKKKQASKHKCEKKTTVRILQATKWWGCIWEDLDMPESKKENNAIWTNYVKAKMDNTYTLPDN